MSSSEICRGYSLESLCPSCVPTGIENTNISIATGNSKFHVYIINLFMTFTILLHTQQLCVYLLVLLIILLLYKYLQSFLSIHVLMRDEKEGRSKQGQTNNKTKQHSTPKAVTFPKRNGLPRVGLEPATLYMYRREYGQLTSAC